MTTTGDLLNQVVPTLVRVARRPGAVLLRVAASMIGLLALLGLVRGLTGDEVAGDGVAAWVPLVLAGVLAVPVVILAVRRERLQAQTQGLDLHRVVVASRGTLVVPDGDPLRDPLRNSERNSQRDSQQQELDSLSAAMAENAVRTARFFPRVEAAQRAALLAAGGPVNAPYLRDDLRVTIGALVGTVAAVPLAGLGVIVTAVLLLAN